MPFARYMRPDMGLGMLYIPLQRFAICISLSIYNYYCLFPKSPEDVSRRYFVVVRGKTTIKAVWANLKRLGGNYVARTHHARVGVQCIASATNEVYCDLLYVGH